MENAAEALKIAFAVLLFVMALTLSMSSFSQASIAIQNIISLRDRASDYTYVQPSENLTRTVGIETVISSIYRSNHENVRIYILDTNNQPIMLYETTDNKKEKMDYIDYSAINTQIGHINRAPSQYSNKSVEEFLDILIGGNKVDDWERKYDVKLVNSEGLYEKFKKTKFDEYLGEYEQGEGTTKMTKRVITYKIIKEE